MDDRGHLQSSLLAAVDRPNWSVSNYRRGSRLRRARLELGLTAEATADRLNSVLLDVLTLEGGFPASDSTLGARYADLVSRPEEELRDPAPKVRDYFGSAAEDQILLELRTELSSPREVLAADPLRSGDFYYLMAQFRSARGANGEAAAFLRLARHYYADVAVDLALICERESVALMLDEAEFEHILRETPGRADPGSEQGATIFSRALGAISDLFASPLQPLAVKGDADLPQGRQVQLYSDTHSALDGVSTEDFFYTISIEQTNAEEQPQYLLSCRLGTRSGPIPGVRIRLRNRGVEVDGMTDASGVASLLIVGSNLDPSVMSENDKAERLEIQILFPPASR